MSLSAWEFSITGSNFLFFPAELAFFQIGNSQSVRWHTHKCHNCPLRGKSTKHLYSWKMFIMLHFQLQWASTYPSSLKYNHKKHTSEILQPIKLSVTNTRCVVGVMSWLTPTSAHVFMGDRDQWGSRRNTDAGRRSPGYCTPLPPHVSY